MWLIATGGVELLGEFQLGVLVGLEYRAGLPKPFAPKPTQQLSCKLDLSTRQKKSLAPTPASAAHRVSKLYNACLSPNILPSRSLGASLSLPLRGSIR